MISKMFGKKKGYKNRELLSILESTTELTGMRTGASKLYIVVASLDPGTSIMSPNLFFGIGWSWRLFLSLLLLPLLLLLLSTPPLQSLFSLLPKKKNKKRQQQQGFSLSLLKRARESKGPLMVNPQLCRQTRTFSKQSRSRQKQSTKKQQVSLDDFFFPSSSFQFSCF